MFSWLKLRPHLIGAVTCDGCPFREAPYACVWRKNYIKSIHSIQSRPRRLLIRAGLLIVLGPLPVFVSHGQEALNSALSAEAAINSQTNATVAPPPNAWSIGPMSLNLGTYLGVTFDDNVNTSQDHPESDVSIHPGLNLGFLLPVTANSEIRLDTQLGYSTYLAKTRSDSIEIAPDSALTWNISFEDGTLTLYDQFNYSDDVITVASVSDTTSLPRFDNTIGVRAQWLPEKWLVEAGISHSDFRSSDPSLDYLNRGSEYLYLRGARRVFAENTQVGLEFSASQTEYQIKIQSDNASYSLGPFASWNITQFINAEIRGGPTIYPNDAAGTNQPASTLQAYYFKFDLSHQLTKFISHRLTASEDVSLGFNKGNNYNQQLTVDYAIDWSATANARFGLDLTYEKGTQPLTIEIFRVTENYDRMGISASASYQLTDKLGSSLSFAHWHRTSNIFGNNYEENSVSLQLNYHF